MLAVQIVTTFPVFVVVLCCLLYSSKVILCDSRWMMKQRTTKRCVFAGGLLAVALQARFTNAWMSWLAVGLLIIVATGDGAAPQASILKDQLEVGWTGKATAGAPVWIRPHAICYAVVLYLVLHYFDSVSLLDLIYTDSSQWCDNNLKHGDYDSAVSTAVVLFVGLDNAWFDILLLLGLQLHRNRLLLRGGWSPAAVELNSDLGTYKSLRVLGRSFRLLPDHAFITDNLLAPIKAKVAAPIQHMAAGYRPQLLDQFLDWVAQSNWIGFGLAFFFAGRVVAQYWDASNQALDVQPSFLLGLLHAILIMLLGVVLVRPDGLCKLVGSIVPGIVVLLTLWIRKAIGNGIPHFWRRCYWLLDPLPGDTSAEQPCRKGEDFSETSADMENLINWPSWFGIYVNGEASTTFTLPFCISALGSLTVLVGLGAFILTCETTVPNSGSDASQNKHLQARDNYIPILVCQLLALPLVFLYWIEQTGQSGSQLAESVAQSTIPTSMVALGCGLFVLIIADRAVYMLESRILKMLILWCAMVGFCVYWISVGFVSTGFAPAAVMLACSAYFYQSAKQLESKLKRTRGRRFTSGDPKKDSPTWVHKTRDLVRAVPFLIELVYLVRAGTLHRNLLPV
eukprot:COSAG04_NODE_1303_length_7305_cov_10.223980_3_plen_623_part_00